MMPSTPPNSISSSNESVSFGEPISYLDLLNGIEHVEYLEHDIHPNFPPIPFAQKRSTLFDFCISWLEQYDRDTWREDWLERGDGHEDVEQAIQELALWAGLGVPDNEWGILVKSATIAFAGLQGSVYNGEYAMIISHKRYLTAVRHILSRIDEDDEVSVKLMPYLSVIQEQCDYMCELEEQIEKLDEEVRRMEELSEGTEYVAFLDATELGLIVPTLMDLVSYYQGDRVL